MERGTRRTASSRSPTCTPRPNIAAKWPPCSLGGRSSAPSPGRRATRREDCRHLQASWRARAGLGAAERSGAAGQVLARLRAARAGWTGPLQSGHQVCPRRCFGQIHGFSRACRQKTAAIAAAAPRRQRRTGLCEGCGQARINREARPDRGALHRRGADRRHDRRDRPADDRRRSAQNDPAIFRERRSPTPGAGAQSRRGKMTDLRYPIGEFSYPGEQTADERRRAIDEIEATPVRLRAAVQGLSPQQLDTPYRPGGWTVRQVVHHVPDSHLNAYTRFKLALTEDEPTIKPYDEARWAELADVRTAPLGVSFRLLEALHQRWVLLLRSLRPEDYRRTLRHPERGVMSLDQTLCYYAWHGRHHVAHITSLRERMGWG